MKWFKHQSDARNSLKLRKLRRKYGSDGYAIYWFCLEAIAYDVDKDNLTFDLKEDAETIGFELSIQEKRVEEIMRYSVEIGLFESSGNVITCLKLAESIDKSMTNSPKMRAWIGRQAIMTESENVMTSHDSVNTCPELELELEKEVDKNKELDQQAAQIEVDQVNIDKAFDSFWKNWTNKVGKEAARKSFTKLFKGKTRDQAREILVHMLNYQKMALLDIEKNKNNSQYIGFDKKHASSFINQKQWRDLTNDEIEVILNESH